MRYLLFLLPLLLTACFTSKKKVESFVVAKELPPQITDSTHYFVHVCNSGKDSSLWELNYQYYHSPTMAWQDKVNEQIRHWYSVELEIPEIQGTNPNAFFKTLGDSIDQRATRFYKLSEHSVGWYYRTNSSIDDHHADFVELCISYQGYFGGEDENVKHQYLHISKEDNRMLKLSDFVSDTSAFTQIAESYFRQHQGMSQFDIYSEFGFWFENSVFYCSQNFSFLEEELHFYYDPVEIAPSDKGIIEFGVPLSAVSHLLKRGK